MAPQLIGEVVTEWFKKFRVIQKDVHLLCPKQSDEDEEDYTHVCETGDEEKKKRIAEAKERANIVYWCSLVLAMPTMRKEKPDLEEELNDRLSNSLRACDRCVMNWHMYRKVWLNSFAEEYNEAGLKEAERLFRILDHARLDNSLDWAVKMVESVENEYQTFRVSHLGSQRLAFLLTVYDALCDLSYLALPDKRHLFLTVFYKINSKKPLRLGAGSILPAMTAFLFREDPVALKFAQTSWRSMEAGSMTPEQFDWAVNEPLADAISRVAALDASNPNSYPLIQQFWEGFSLILPTLSEGLVTHKLRAMEVSPTPYDLLFGHMSCSSEGILVNLIKSFSALLEKAPSAFWDAVGDPKPFAVAEQIFASPVFRSLLSQSMEIGMEEANVDNPPFTVSWMYSWIKSVKKNEKSDACQSLVNMLFDRFTKDPSISPEGHAACARAGFDALNNVLESFLTVANARGQFPNALLKVFVSPNNILHLNAAINMAYEFKDHIAEWAEKPSQPFDAHKAAMKVIRTALELDSRATAEEYKSIHLGRPYQTVVKRQSASLWQGFLDLLYPGNLEQARHVLHGMFPLLPVESFRPMRKAIKPMDQSKSQFNETFDKLSVAVGTVLQRLCQFPPTELDDLSRDGMRVILAFSFHGADVIRESAIELLKTMTGKHSRSDAIVRLVSQQPAGTIRIFNFAINQTVKPPLDEDGEVDDVGGGGTMPPYGPVPHILSVAQDILSSLCDPATGLLRTAELSQSTLDIVFSWWTTQWYWIETVFKYTEKWSHYIEIPVMTNLCRQMIELAESLVAEDALLASALKEEFLKRKSSVPQDEAKVQADMMRKVLNACSKYLYGLTKMLRLRDTYLVSITTKIVRKLLERLKEFDLEIGANSRSYIYRTCKVTSEGKYEVGTNLTRQQKAELLMALDGDDAEVEIISERRVPEPPKTKKQSKLDLWTKAGAGERTNRDDVLALSSTIDKRKSALDLIAQRQAVKPRAAVTKPMKPVTQPSLSDAARIKALKESRQKAKEDKKKRDLEYIEKMKRMREETAPAIRSEIMVDSSDEEEEDESGDEDLDAFISKQRADQQAQNDAERRRARALLETHRQPVKKRKLNLTEKDIRARIDPNMGPLHHAILQWDIFHQGVDPPNSPAVSQVSNTYKDEVAYKNTFSPLLLHEAWRSFVTAMDESTAKPFGMKIASRMNFDGFIQVTSSMPLSEKTRERVVGEGDLVLISKSENPLQDREAPHCLSRIHKIQYKQGNLEIEYRVSPNSRTILPELMPNKVLYVAKITNMTTIEREYATLQGLQHYDLLEEVLAAKPSPVQQYGEDGVQHYIDNYNLNRAQARAVLGAKNNDGFTLIQGPPGTGKTKTIIAMVGCLLTGTLNTPAAVASKPTGGSIKKLLVCAPSNAAVDELVLRLKNGVKTTGGSERKINVIRLGRSDAINAAVKDVTLEELVNRRLEAENVMDNVKADREKIHTEAAEIKQKVDELWVKVSIARDAGNRDEMSKFSRELDSWRRRQTQVGAKIDELKSSGRTVSREIDIKRMQFQREILSSAHVLCATLSGSGHEIFKSLTDVDFETVIIDEAAQCVELSALIPLKYGCVKCILVGDPKQLPPTVLSQSAARYGYDQSLFVRMQRSYPADVHLLDMQYRMHPLISQFPSREFYEGRLIDGADMATLRRQPWHASAVFSPYRFFDVKGVQQKGHRGQSLVNVQELNVAMQLYERLRTDYRECDFKRKIGIITPYKAQLYELRNRFSARYGNDITETIEFNTTDAFQGRECEIIIFSCVRASPTGGIGFMTDIRRMNVGLTRAKSSLWILGDSRALVQGEFWAKLIDDAKNRQLYTQGDVLGLLKRPTEKRPLPAIQPGAAIQPSAGIQPSAPQVNHQAPDVVMTDAPRSGISSPAAQSPTFSHRVTGLENRPIPRQILNRRIHSIDGRGQVTPEVPSIVGRPVIHSTVDSPQSAQAKKRPHNGQDDSGGPATKKATGPNHGNDNSAQSRKSGPKILQGKLPHMRPPHARTPKVPPKPIDPAAMDALGLRPPQRPPPPQQPQQPAQPHHPQQHQGPPPAGPDGGAPPRPPPSRPQNMPPRPPKKGPNVFINKRNRR